MSKSKVNPARQTKKSPEHMDRLYATRLTSAAASSGNLPNDPLFKQQWYLLNNGQTGGTAGVDLNVVSVWRDYTGLGVKVGLIDDGVQYVHPDLNKNYDTTADIDVDEADNDAAAGSFDAHGTSVAGIIAATANNSQGGVGVAYGAKISSIRMGFPPVFGPYDQEVNALEAMTQFDVVNNSWGFYPFVDDFSDPYFQRHATALQNAARNGRNGLGTVVVFAGGNGRDYGEQSNYNNLQNSRFSIAVAALDHNGVYTYYSSPGANLLVSAFGGDDRAAIATTDRLGVPGYNLSANSYSASDYTDQFGGTSAATPMVAGIAALMLEANPTLGYRDIQEILAYSARQTDARNKNWQTNGAKNWNGGGLHTSLDYGFGLVNAHAAVRLAETWTKQSTAANEQTISASSDRLKRIPDQNTVTDTINVTSKLRVSHVEVSLNLFHTFPADLRVVLTSPNGTQSVLADQPDVSSTSLKFTFSSTQYWGETSVGTWKLILQDVQAADAGVLSDWTLRLYGEAPSENDLYVYTNEFRKFAPSGNRQILQDAQGTDTLNASAITTNTTLNLTPGSSSTLAGRSLKIENNTVIENAFTGDGNDVITGNGLGNTLNGGRGNDRVRGFGGHDVIDGGQGNDTLVGDEGADTLIGGAGDDRLMGGADNDVLTGGLGSDRFIYRTESAFNPTAIGIDLITDFTSTRDKIVLDKSTFTALTSAVGEGFSATREFAAVASDSAVADSSAFIVFSLATGSLFYNANGVASGLGAGAKFTTLLNKPILTANDFVLTA